MTTPMTMHVNPRKTTSVRALGEVDVAALAEAVLALPQSVWDAENASKPNRFEALDRTQHVVFRFVSKFVDWREAYDRPLMAQWRPLLEPVLDHVVKSYGYTRGSFPRIMLARMAPGGVIHPHVDANPAAKWPHKIHVPLTTNEKTTFFVGDAGHHFPVGQAFEVNNMGPHAVKNEGDSDRIHLIFEYYDLDQPAPDWVDEVVAQAVAR
jgi:hypothetical protein